MMVAMSSGIEILFEGYDERLDPDQVAAALKLSPGTVRRYLRSGVLPGYCLSDSTKAPWVIVKSELIDALKTRWNQGLPPVAADTEPAGDGKKG
jgi:hypothetical protein